MLLNYRKKDQQSQKNVSIIQDQQEEIQNHMKQICHKPFKSAKPSCPKQDHIKFLFAKPKFV
jgi:hypothetical protein